MSTTINELNNNVDEPTICAKFQSKLKSLEPLWSHTECPWVNYGCPYMDAEQCLFFFPEKKNG